MKYLAILLIALLASCGSFTTSPQTIQSVAFFGAYKVLDNSSAAARPGREQQVRAAASELSMLADGSLSREEVGGAFRRYFSGDPDLALLGTLLLQWFPESLDTAAASDLARNAALGLNAALPDK